MFCGIEAISNLGEVSTFHLVLDLRLSECTGGALKVHTAMTTNQNTTIRDSLSWRLTAVVAITVLVSTCASIEVVIIKDQGLVIAGFGYRTLLPAIAFVLQNKIVAFAATFGVWLTCVVLSFKPSPNLLSTITIICILVVVGAANLILLTQWTESLRIIVRGSGLSF